MAPRRHKGRKGARRRASHKRSDPMSHNNESNAPHSARPSTEGAMSIVTASDGHQTAMTSLMGTDDEISDTHDEDEADDGLETTSIYPASQFPQLSNMHRSGGYFIPGDSRNQVSDIASSTRSLWAMDLDYREIHGRRYCRDYYMPNDELEQLRLTLQHQAFLHLLDNELTLAPLQDPTNVLDVGTGTGDWAIRFAEMYPRCEVVGTDISAIAETKSVPINVFFEIEDAEDWDRPPDHYDLVHLRWLQGAFRQWRAIYDSAFYSLKPGGWIEVLDFETSDSLMKFLASFPPHSTVHRLFRDLEVAADRSGRSRSSQHLDPRLFMDSGFVDIRVTEYALPIILSERSINKIWLITCLDGLEAICLRLLTEYMDWDPDECKTACELAARELANLARDPAMASRLIFKMQVVVARKPLDAELSDASWPAEPSSCCSEHEREETPSLRETPSNGAR